MIDTERLRVGELISTKMQLCGCGELGRALKAIRDVLESIYVPQGVYTGPEHDAAWDRRKISVPPIWDNGFGLLAYYIVDMWELTEHGGSIPGWLTDDGYSVLRFLQETECDDQKWEAAEEEYLNTIKP